METDLNPSAEVVSVILLLMLTGTKYDGGCSVKELACIANGHLVGCKVAIDNPHNTGIPIDRECKQIVGIRHLTALTVDGINIDMLKIHTVGFPSLHIRNNL